jgi:hypothetical protein
MSPEKLPLERLEQEITELAAHIHAATCRWLCLVAEFDRRDGWAQWGAKSCATWISWTCGVAPNSAREHVRVARRLDELPTIRDAFAAGELSYSKVRAVTRVATAENANDLLMLARHATAAQLERVVRGYRDAASAELGVANRAHRERFLTWHWDDDGSLVLRGRLPADEGALMVAAVEAGRDAVHRDLAVARCDEAEDDAGCVSAETSLPSARAVGNADALVLMAETVLAHGATPAPGGERHQIVVHVDVDTLRDASEGNRGRCELDDGPAIPAATAQRLACDASVIPILESAARPLSVGRQTRSIPASIRRALRSRDDGCRFPGCTQRRFVDAHHIDHWAHGGETKLSNLVLLCRHHHRLVHEGGYRLERMRAGEVVFRRPDGRQIAAAPAPRRGDHSVPARVNRRGGLRISPETCIPLSLGQSVDHGMAVEGRLGRDGALRPREPA